MKRLRFTSFIVFLLAAVLAACGGDGDPIDEPNLMTFQLFAERLSVPGSATVNTPVEVVVVTSAFRKEAIEKNIQFSEEYQSVSIRLSETVNTRSLRLWEYPPLVELRIPVTFTSMGDWTVRVDTSSGRMATKMVVVHGDWLGDEKPAEVGTFQFTAAAYAGYAAPLTVSVSHEDGDWFVFRHELHTDPTTRAATVAVSERRAETAWEQGAWVEELEIPLVLPDSGRWRLNVGENAFALREVAETPDWRPAPEAVLYQEDAKLVLPSGVEVAGSIHVNEPTALGILLESKDPAMEVLGFDFVFGRDASELNGRMWVPRSWEPPTWEEVEPKTTTVELTFPVFGEWTIRFEGEAGTEAFTTTVTVLPEEG